MMCAQILDSVLDRGNRVITQIDMGRLGEPLQVSHALTCSSESTCYVLKDTVHGRIYIGQCGRQVRVRHNEHVRAIVNKSTKSPVAKYFNEKGLSKEHFWMCPAVKVVGGEFVRKAVESTLIEKYNTTILGLNTNH